MQHLKYDFPRKLNDKMTVRVSEQDRTVSVRHFTSSSSQSGWSIQISPTTTSSVSTSKLKVEILIVTVSVNCGTKGLWSRIYWSWK